MLFDQKIEKKTLEIFLSFFWKVEYHGFPKILNSYIITSEFDICKIFGGNTGVFLASLQNCILRLSVSNANESTSLSLELLGSLTSWPKGGTLHPRETWPWVQPEKTAQTSHANCQLLISVVLTKSTALVWIATCIPGMWRLWRMALVLLYSQVAKMRGCSSSALYVCTRGQLQTCSWLSGKLK